MTTDTTTSGHCSTAADKHAQFLTPIVPKPSPPKTPPTSSEVRDPTGSSSQRLQHQTSNHHTLGTEHSSSSSRDPYNTRTASKKPEVRGHSTLRNHFTLPTRKFHQPASQPSPSARPLLSSSNFATTIPIHLHKEKVPPISNSQSPLHKPHTATTKTGASF